MGMNSKLSEQIALLAVINPVSQAAATVTTGWVDMAKFNNALAVLSVGALGASATVDAKIQQATDGSGTGVKDVTGRAITQLTKAGSDDNKQVEINIKQDDLDIAGGFAFIRLSVTVAVAACLISAEVWGGNTNYSPASELDATTVDEIVG